MHDLDKLYHWFQEPTIQKLYARGQLFSRQMIEQKYLPRIDGRENIPGFIMHYQGQPIGFIQYYCLTESLPEGIGALIHPFFNQYQARDIAGIDLFIAENPYRNRGLGTNIIQYFISNYLQNFKAIIVDPESSNLQAIRCYEKAGFIKTNHSLNPNYCVMVYSVRP